MRISEGHLAIGGLIVFAAWLFVGLPWLNAPVERIVYYENVQPTPKSTLVEPKGTAQAPYVVQVLPTKKTAEERTEEAAEHDEKVKTELALVRWTAAVAIFTLGLIGATIFLAYSTRLQGKIMLAIESPFPMVIGYNLVEYSQIPGEKSVQDPVPPGPIPPNCRFLFCIENKGRSHLRLKNI